MLLSILWQWIYLIFLLLPTILLSIFLCNMVGVLRETGTAYHSRAAGATPFCFGEIHVIQLFSFKCSIVFYLFCLPPFCVLCPAFSVSLGCSNFVPSFWFSLTLTKCFRCINNHIFALNNFHGYTSLVLTLRRYHMTINVSGYRV